MNNSRIEYITALYGQISDLTAELEGISSKQMPTLYELVSDEITLLQRETLDLFGDELEVFVRAMVEFDDFNLVKDKINYNLSETWGGCCEIKRLPDDTEIVVNDYFVLIARDNKVLYYLAR